MKKKIVTILMTAAIGTSLLAGQAVMAADTETATEAKADDTGDSKETEEEKTIGKKPETDKDAEGVFSLKFKNLTGKVITEVTVKNEKDEKYPDNFLEKDDKFAADEERTLWFDPNADTEDAAETADDKDTEEASETSEPEVQKYDMQITFEDGTTATLHTLPFGDTEEAELHLEGEVAYIVFDSKDLKKSVNTKETEQHWHRNRQKHRHSRHPHRQRITAMMTVMMITATMTTVMMIPEILTAEAMIPEILTAEAMMDVWTMQF